MPTPTEIAEKFSRVDVHDDTIESFTFHPAPERNARAKAKVTVTLFRQWTNTHRILTLTDCRNIDFVVDADVLKDNSPINTALLEATADVDAIEAVMRKQKREWNVSYEKSIDPMPAKLTGAGRHVIFRVQLFGGRLVVVARSFNIKRLVSTETTSLR